MTNQQFALASKFQWLLGALLAVITCWAYWPIWTRMMDQWSSPQYSHGYLVPLFAIALLWLRRQGLQTSSLRASWWGLALVVLGVLLYLAGGRIYFEWFEYISLLPLLAGVALLLGGLGALRWSWPAIGFLIFMIPLPFRVETALINPLRTIATQSSTYVLQTLGLPALAEGNVIRINEAKIGVVEACSGLSMLMVFFALSTAVAFLCRRDLWEKIVVLLSAVPIALLSNVIRITITSVLHVNASKQAADVFHDVAGWLMMPLALGFLWLELWLMGRLFLERESAKDSLPVMGAVNRRSLIAASATTSG
jgi:exosortase